MCELEFEFVIQICEVEHPYAGVMTHSFVCNDSSTCVPRLIHVRDMMQPRMNLRRTILALIHQLLAHDQTVGAHLLTPALQANEHTLFILADYVIADFEAARTPAPLKGVVARLAMESILLLTRDAYWMSGYGGGGGGGGGGRGDVRQCEVLFERVVEPLTSLLVTCFHASTRYACVYVCVYVCVYW